MTTENSEERNDSERTTEQARRDADGTPTQRPTGEARPARIPRSTSRVSLKVDAQRAYTLTQSCAVFVIIS